MLGEDKKKSRKKTNPKQNPKKMMNPPKDCSVQEAETSFTLCLEVPKQFPVIFFQQNTVKGYYKRTWCIPNSFLHWNRRNLISLKAKSYLSLGSFIFLPRFLWLFQWRKMNEIFFSMSGSPNCPWAELPGEHRFTSCSRAAFLIKCWSPSASRRFPATPLIMHNGYC